MMIYRWLCAACLLLVATFSPGIAHAGTPVYAGNLQVTNGANLTFLSGGSGCMLVAGGVAYIAACPVGTVAFSAAAPFTVTGVGPYVIGCPTCFTTTGGTITGATTFSNTVGMSGVLTESAKANFSGGADGGGLVNIGTSAANNSDAIHIGSTCATTNRTDLGTNSAISVNGIAGSALLIYCTSGLSAFDTSGNLGILGQMTASQFNVSSKRADKQDIQPLSLDALQVLHHTDWAAYRYKSEFGDPSIPHIGFIADDTPSVLSGKNHDHNDIEALATIDAQAVLQLESEVRVLILILCAFAIGIGYLLARRA